jgi:putative RNA 2'-phosphotransferase
VSVPPERLSRLVSHALRHEPWLYELELDEQGWTPVEALLAAVHEQGPEWVHVGAGDLAEMIAGSAKQRHEIDGGRIRALYGHSVPGRVTLSPGDPPAVLFHGTSPKAWAVICREGLRPMGRQYVHLSVDVATAEQVGRRKAAQPLLLTVDTAGAAAAGARFWRGNELVWLTDRIDAEHLAVRG